MIVDKIRKVTELVRREFVLSPDTFINTEQTAEDERMEFFVSTWTEDDGTNAMVTTSVPAFGEGGCIRFSDVDYTYTEI